MKKFDIKNIVGRIGTIKSVPTYIPLKFFEQIKILIPPSADTDARAAATANPNEVVLNSLDVTWPYNITGQAITSTSTGAMPPPLVSGTTYYIIRVSNGLCKLASSYANALANTPIAITASETGIWTIKASNVPLPSLYIYDTINNAWKYALLT